MEEKEKKVVISISTTNLRIRCRDLAMAYTWLLHYSDRVVAHFDYVIRDFDSNRVIEEDTL